MPFNTNVNFFRHIQIIRNLHNVFTNKIVKPSIEYTLYEFTFVLKYKKIKYF